MNVFTEIRNTEKEEIYSLWLMLTWTGVNSASLNQIPKPYLWSGSVSFNIQSATALTSS